jgi:hypothetical protein
MQAAYIAFRIVCVAAAAAAAAAAGEGAAACKALASRIRSEDVQKLSSTPVTSRGLAVFFCDFFMKDVKERGSFQSVTITGGIMFHRAPAPGQMETIP